MRPDAIIGANGRRRAWDFYPTPPECTIALLDFLQMHGLISVSDVVWEPACGEGAIVSVLEGRGMQVLATDIQHGVDFLESKEDDRYCNWIITNPPFSKAQEFILRCIREDRPFALLLKSQFWHAKSRYSTFVSHPPAFVLPLCWRADFTGEGKSLIDVCWCVWYGTSKFTQYIPLLNPRKTITKGDAYGKTKT